MMHVSIFLIRDHWYGGGGAVFERRNLHEGLPPPPCPVSPGYFAPQRWTSPGGFAVYETRRPQTFYPLWAESKHVLLMPIHQTLPNLQKEEPIAKIWASNMDVLTKRKFKCSSTCVIFIHDTLFSSCSESHSEGSDWLWASGCQRNGVSRKQEVCAQRPCGTQLHVSRQSVQKHQ